MAPQFIARLVLAEAGQLTRIPLAKIGTWWKGKQKFSITLNDCREMVANFRRKALAEVVIDYDHGTEFAAGSGQPVPASGWLKEIEDGPDRDGVLWGQAEFTERARGMLAANEYKYVSAVIKWGVPDKSSGERLGAMITSVALTNIPVLEEMPAIALSEAGWKETKTMGVTKVILADRSAGKVRVVLEDGTESVVVLEGLEAAPKVVALSDVARKDGMYDFSTLPQEGLIAAEVLNAMQVQIVLNEAVAAGKILPAQRAAYEKLPLGDLKTLVLSMAPQIDLGERGIGGGGEGAGDLKKVDHRIGELVKAKQTADPKLSYGQAYKLVLSEHEDLRRRRAELIRAE